MNSGMNELDNELDLVSFISILSLCICFLLLSVIWIKVGTLSVKQAVGGEPSGLVESSYEVSIKKNGSIRVDIKNMKNIDRSLRSKNFATIEGGVDEDGLALYLDKVKTKFPNIKTTFIHPEARTKYKLIIDVVDIYRKKEILDIGIMPL